MQSAIWRLKAGIRKRPAYAVVTRIFHDDAADERAKELGKIFKETCENLSIPIEYGIRPTSNNVMVACTKPLNDEQDTMLKLALGEYIGDRPKGLWLSCKPPHFTKVQNWAVNHVGIFIGGILATYAVAVAIDMMFLGRSPWLACSTTAIVGGYSIANQVYELLDLNRQDYTEF